jgi:hypothetical protein
MGISIFVFALKCLNYNVSYNYNWLNLYLLSYFAISVLISVFIVYFYGPITNQRYIFFLKCFLKFVSVIFIYMGLDNIEIFIKFFSFIFVIKSIILLKNIIFTFYEKFRNKLFPKKRRLLTRDEYATQAKDYTDQKLKELKNFCKSTQCDSWKIIESLNSPQR